MIKSMTGYGRNEGDDGEALFRVEIRSVNHRYKEVMVRMPRELFQLEEAVKREIQASFSRGRFDVFITFESDAHVGPDVSVDWKYAHQVVRLAQEMKNRFNLSGEIAISDLCQMPDVLTSREVEANIEKWRAPLLHIVREACTSLKEMRSVEGASLARDIRKRSEQIRKHIGTIHSRASHVLDDYRDRLTERMRDFLQGLDIDEARLLTEAALYAEKANIDEEVTRLGSHCQQMQHMLNLSEPVGRKLDFLVQEMNREINTIGSKANDLTISQLVVEVKSELEKIREQVQNVE